MNEVHNAANYTKLKRDLRNQELAGTGDFTGLDTGMTAAELLARIPNHWTVIPARGGSISGTGMRYLAPPGASGAHGITEVRLMTRPDGSQYVRLYRENQPVDLSGQPQSRGLSHFEIEIGGFST
jgi:hypothetical protein